MTAPIAPGQPAPDFTLKAHDDTTRTLSELRGQRVLLVFYPLDFSPVCTQEMACFMEDLAAFNEAGVQVFGISVDSVWAHKAFAEARGITFPLLADFHPKGAVAARYGLYDEEKGISRRAVVLVDEDGKVARVWNFDIPEVPDVKAILAEIKG